MNVPTLVSIICSMLVIASLGEISEVKFQSNARNSQTEAEMTFEKPIYTDFPDKPLPQGKVDVNPPWLHFYEPELDDSLIDKSIYFFKLSQDKGFKKNVYYSKAKKWSFYNTYEPLKKGQWYWKYATATADNINNLNWSDIYEFKITGNETLRKTPSAKTVINKVLREQKLGNSRFTYLPINIDPNLEIGKLSDVYIKQIDRAINNLLNSDKLSIQKKEYEDDYDGPENGKANYVRKKINQKFTTASKKLHGLIRAYLLKGNEELSCELKKIIFTHFNQLDKIYFKLLDDYQETEDIPGSDVASTKHTLSIAMMLNIFKDEFTNIRKNELIDFYYRVKTKGYLNFNDQLGFSEHKIYKAHLWQGQVVSLMEAAITLLPYKPKEAKEWLEYTYELFLHRSPAGSRYDGGWHGGSSYYTSNINHLIKMPLVFKGLTGYDYFDHPWYDNVARFGSIAKAPGNPIGHFGDADEISLSKKPTTLDIALAYLKPENYWNLWRLKSFGQNEFISGKFLTSESEWLTFLIKLSTDPPNLDDVELPLETSALFKDTGYVAINSDITKVDENLSILFRSCPFGTVNHAHPAHNAVNIAYGGKPLFHRTGHKDGDDSHKKTSYKHTNAHNSVIIGEKGQEKGAEAFGWIPRFISGTDMTYFAGDATHAYEPTLGVKKFRRHVAYLKPNFIVMYDVLEANEAVSWELTLHNLSKLKATSQNSILSKNMNFRAHATLYSSIPAKLTVTNEFISPPKKSSLNDHWHSRYKTKKEKRKNRFLTIIQVIPNGNTITKLPESSESSEDGKVILNIGQFKLRAQLNCDKPSFLCIKSNNGGSALVTGEGSQSIRYEGNEYITPIVGSTLFFDDDPFGNGKLLIEQVDILPDAVKYGNKF